MSGSCGDHAENSEITKLNFKSEERHKRLQASVHLYAFVSQSNGPLHSTVVWKVVIAAYFSEVFVRSEVIEITLLRMVSVILQVASKEPVYLVPHLVLSTVMLSKSPFALYHKQGDKCKHYRISPVCVEFRS